MLELQFSMSSVEHSIQPQNRSIVASVADTICLSSSVAASGPGQAPPGISGFLDGASNVLLALSMDDGLGEAMIAYRSVRVGNYIGGAWFRVEIGSFAGSGGRRLIHFHFNPFPDGTTEIMRYHLPYQWRA